LIVSDLCALATKNDPFYVGTPGQRAGAEWFAGLWRRFGYDDGVHLRRVHYEIDGQESPVLKPNGEALAQARAWRAR